MIDTNDMRERLRNYDVSDEELLSLCDEIDRLRGEKPKQQQGKTVMVKVAVAVDNKGRFDAVGESGKTDSELMEKLGLTSNDRLYWLTAKLPVPEEVTVEAEVEND